MANVSSQNTKNSISRNNKLKNKGLFGKSFDLRNRKVQFFVFILIIAVLGGGWNVYKSFASAGQAITNTYTDFKFPNDQDAVNGYSNLYWTVKPISDPSPQGIFWSHQFWFKNSQLDSKNPGLSAGYAGLQTGANGKTVRFSIWHSLNSYAGQLPNTKIGIFANEGWGNTVYAPFDWKVNTSYNFRVYKANSSPRIMWNADITDTSNGRTYRIGTIEVSSNWGGLEPYTSVWTEYFGGTIANCSQIPYIGVEYLLVSVKNNSTRLPVSQTDSYEQGQNCGNNSKITPIQYGSRQEIWSAINRTSPVDKPKTVTPKK